MAVGKFVGKDKVGRIGVLMGGPSTERKISLKSGKAVYKAFRQLGLDAVPIDIKSDKLTENAGLIRSYKIDCAFVALHGRFGEDGQIQRILEILGLPYTGSGVRASKMAMDKAVSRKVFRDAGLDVPKYSVLNKFPLSRKKEAALRDNLVFPLVIKPATGGSSIGLSIIEEEKDFKRALEFAFTFDEKVIIEEYVAGRELTVGILGEKALPVIEIITKNKFFDYEAKYHHGLTDYKVPASLEKNIEKKVQRCALLCHKLLGCFGCSRVDIILDKKNRVFILEVNTIPGMTNTSLLPKAARFTGISFDELCLKLIKLAYEKK